MYYDSLYGGVDKKPEDYDTEIEYITNKKMLLNIVYNLFAWDNLPDNLSSRFIEMTLVNNGMIAFYENEDYGLMSLPCDILNENFYYEPERIQVFSYTSSGKHVQDTLIDNFVIGRNNIIGLPLLQVVELYARKITDVSQTCDINIGNQKTPYIIKSSQKSRLTIKNIYDKVRRNCPAIFVNKKVGKISDIIEVMPTPSPYIADKLLNYKHELINEFLTYIGINNANTDKKERLITDEVNSNNEFVQSIYDNMKEQRELLRDRVNEMFGTDIKLICKVKKECDVNCQNTQPNLDI